MFVGVVVSLLMPHDRFCNICLNPHKCIFFVKYKHLLGFIVSKYGIRADLDKVKEVTQFQEPQSTLQLQHLQGKVNFLRRFIVNYVELTKGVSYLWDDQAQQSFYAFKKALISAPLLSTPNYWRDFLLYLEASPSSLGMFLVQTHDDRSENVIYYLLNGVARPKLRYSHVEKLSLAVFFAINHFRHYILLRQTTFIALENPMRHILSHQVIGGKYSKWIMILQQFDLVFTAAKAKNSLVFRMKLYILSTLLTLGMVTFLSTSKCNASTLSYCQVTIVTSSTKRDTI